MVGDRTHGCTRRRFLANVIGTPALAALPRDAMTTQTPPSRVAHPARPESLTSDPWKYSLTDLGLFDLETQRRLPVVF